MSSQGFLKTREVRFLDEEMILNEAPSSEFSEF
jgi:hypothetical protein